MLHMGYSSPSVIALVYILPSSTKIFDSIQWHTGGDMIAFISECTRLVFYMNNSIYIDIERTLYIIII